MSIGIYHVLDGYGEYNRDNFEIYKNGLLNVANKFPQHLQIGNTLIAFDDEDNDTETYVIVDIVVGINHIQVYVDDTYCTHNLYIEKNHPNL